MRMPLFTPHTNYYFHNRLCDFILFHQNILFVMCTKNYATQFAIFSTSSPLWSVFKIKREDAYHTKELYSCLEKTLLHSNYKNICQSLFNQIANNKYRFFHGFVFFQSVTLLINLHSSSFSSYLSKKSNA